MDELNGRDASKMSRHNIESDKWDQQDLEMIMAEMHSYARAVDKLCEIATESGGGMSDDALLALLKLAPARVPDEIIRPTHRVNGRVLDEMVVLPKYHELRSMGTVGDTISSALGFEVLEESLEEIFDRLQQAMEAAKRAEGKMIERLKAQEDLRDAEQMLEDMHNPELIAELQELIDQLGQEIADAMGEMESELDANTPSIRAQLTAGLDKAAKQLGDEQNAAKMFGLEPGELTRLPAEKRLAMAKLIKDKPNLARLAELVGPMKRLAFTCQRRKVEYAVDEVYELELGNDLARIIPDELIRLHKPQTRRSFLVDYSEERLQQYKLRGEEAVGKGAIILCSDSSGSMGGERDIYAKAIGLTFGDMAKAQKREFKAILFGSQHEISVHDFPDPASYTFDKILDYAEYFFGGGTVFTTPLTIALEHLQKQHDALGSVNGDIVFLTDGHAHIPDEFMKEFKAEQERLRFQVFGVCIGGAPTADPLHTLCDGKVISVQQLTSGEDLTDIFTNLNRKF